MDYETDDYKIRELDGVTVIRFKNANLTGVLEMSRISDELKAVVETGIRKLVLDFKHVQHCGSAALGLMISLNKEMQRVGGKLVLSHPENINELLKISRTTSLFTIAPDPKAAVAMF